MSYVPTPGERGWQHKRPASRLTLLPDEWVRLRMRLPPAAVAAATARLMAVLGLTTLETGALAELMLEAMLSRSLWRVWPET